MKSLALIVAVAFVAVLCLSFYKIGHMDGKSDLDRWMWDNNVYKFETITCKENYEPNDLQARQADLPRP